MTEHNLQPEYRFWQKVDLDWKTGCWNWVGSKNKDGYGNLSINGKNVTSHRFSYELFKSKISKGLTIDHICRNTSCCNPNHLEIVTIKDNILRGTSFAASNARKTHCPQGHEYTKENTYTTEGRRCRICKLKASKFNYIKQNRNKKK